VFGFAAKSDSYELLGGFTCFTSLGVSVDLADVK
jgi:hypothetical protein